MRKSIKRAFLATTVLVCIAAAAAAANRPIPAQPQNYVVDLAGIVDDATEAKLNRYLQELEQKTTAQFVILTIESLDGEAIESYALEVAHDKWKLGQAGKDNGLLLLVAVKDRKYRIEVGYGLEAVLPDSFVGTVGRDYLVPYFRKGDYSGGIQAAALALVAKIAKNAGVVISGLPEARAAGRKERSGSPLGTIFSLLIFLIVAALFIRNPRGFLLFWLLSSMGGSRRNWGGGGGGFGGGFGSFGGGGGGGFGGGGASGSW